MIHIRNNNFAIQRIDRNTQTLRENNNFLDNIIRLTFGIEEAK